MQNVYINKSERICFQIRYTNAQYPWMSVSDFSQNKLFGKASLVLKKVKHQLRNRFTTILDS
jgi:hypothetical protein